MYALMTCILYIASHADSLLFASMLVVPARIDGSEVPRSVPQSLPVVSGATKFGPDCLQVLHPIPPVSLKKDGGRERFDRKIS